MWTMGSFKAEYWNGLPVTFAPMLLRFTSSLVSEGEEAGFIIFKFRSFILFDWLVTKDKGSSVHCYLSVPGYYPEIDSYLFLMQMQWPRLEFELGFQTSQSKPLSIPRLCLHKVFNICRMQFVFLWTASYYYFLLSIISCWSVS